MRSSPVFVNVNCSGRADKAFGCEGFSADVMVGASKTNSEKLANVSVEITEMGDQRMFTLKINGEAWGSKLYDRTTKEFVSFTPENLHGVST